MFFLMGYMFVVVVVGKIDPRIFTIKERRVFHKNKILIPTYIIEDDDGLEVFCIFCAAVQYGFYAHKKRRAI